MVKSLFFANNILECLSNGINSVTEIAKECGTDKPKVHRFLKTLEELKYAIRDPISHKYYMGPRIAALYLNPQVSHHVLISCAIEEMKRLNDISGDSVGLSILIGIRRVGLYEIPSKHNIKVSQQLDNVSPVLAGSSAKSLFSQLNDKTIEKVLNHIELESLTEKTTTDRDVYKKQIKEIRVKGYAVSNGEVIPGVFSIGVPISNYICPVSIGILGLESRLKPMMKIIIEELMKSAKRISENIAKALL